MADHVFFFTPVLCFFEKSNDVACSIQAEVVDVLAKTTESGLIRPRSAPRVDTVLVVVVLELYLVFDLVDQNLRQEDANQLWYGQSQGNASQQEQVTVDPIHQCVYAAIGVDVLSSFSVL